MFFFLFFSNTFLFPPFSSFRSIQFNFPFPLLSISARTGYRHTLDTHAQAKRRVACIHMDTCSTPDRVLFTFVACLCCCVVLCFFVSSNHTSFLRPSFSSSLLSLFYWLSIHFQLNPFAVFCVSSPFYSTKTISNSLLLLTVNENERRNEAFLRCQFFSQFRNPLLRTGKSLVRFGYEWSSTSTSSSSRFLSSTASIVPLCDVSLSKEAEDRHIFCFCFVLSFENKSPYFIHRCFLHLSFPCLRSCSASNQFNSPFLFACMCAVCRVFFPDWTVLLRELIEIAHGTLNHGTSSF